MVVRQFFAFSEDQTVNAGFRIWIRILMDLHQFELLDPEKYANYPEK
jgi:hypothetical protein